jgi:hypothetical protein
MRLAQKKNIKSFCPMNRTSYILVQASYGMIGTKCGTQPAWAASRLCQKDLYSSQKGTPTHGSQRVNVSLRLDKPRGTALILSLSRKL